MTKHLDAFGLQRVICKTIKMKETKIVLGLKGTFFSILDKNIM